MKKFKKVAALALAAVMILGVASTVDVQAAEAEKEHTVEDVLIVPSGDDSNKEFSSYYADLKYAVKDGVLTAITLTSGFGPQRAELSNVRYTVEALSQYIDWLQTGAGDLSKLTKAADVYSGATSSLGRFGSVHVELPTGLWTSVADKVDITVIRNSTAYTVDGPSATEVITYDGCVENGMRYGFADDGMDKKYSGDETPIQNQPASEDEGASGDKGSNKGNRVTIDEYLTASYVGEEDGWKTFQIAASTDEYDFSTAAINYFFLNYTRFNADEVNENMAVFDAETGLLKINLNSAPAADENAEVIGGLTFAKVTFKVTSVADETVTASGTIKVDLTNPSIDNNNDATDNNGTTGDTSNTEAGNDAASGSTGSTAPKTGDDFGGMYLIMVGGMAVAVVTASRIGRRTRA